MNAPTPTQSRRDVWSAVGLFVLATGVLLLAQRSVGYTRDESVYFAAGRRAAEWVLAFFRSPSAALEDSVILECWGYNSEHPGLFKTAFGLSEWLFHRPLGWLSAPAALRLPAILASATIPSVSYLWGAQWRSRTTGLFAAAAFFCVPRHLFNGVLACFDMPIAAAWLFVTFAAWKALKERSERWAVAAGLAFAVALATKHNALFLPFLLWPVAMLEVWRSNRSGLVRVWLWSVPAAAAGLAVLFVGTPFPEDALSRAAFQTLSAAFLILQALLLPRIREEARDAWPGVLLVTAMAVAGPLGFVGHWPYLWHAPLERIAGYWRFHAHHEHYAWLYLGDLLREPPFPLAYVFVLTALTVPVSILTPMVLGFASTALGWIRAFVRRPFESSSSGPSALVATTFILTGALAPMLIISHPQVPHFGGIKHWLPSMPFWMLLAGVSVDRAAEWASRRAPSHVPPALLSGTLGALCLAPALWATVHVHPYGTAHYSELAGGIPGAASLGMQRQFWSSHVTGVLPWINENAAPDARLFLHEVTPLAFRDYQRDGWLRSDLQWARTPAEADVAAYQYHQEFREQEFEIWNAFGTRLPSTGLYVDETPQVLVYVRPPSAP